MKHIALKEAKRLYIRFEILQEQFGMLQEQCNTAFTQSTIQDIHEALNTNRFEAGLCLGGLRMLNVMITKKEEIQDKDA